MNRLLHRTFITPIDREQIHGLINAMDDVLDLLQDASEVMSLYDLQHITEDVLRLAEISVRCCERVQHVRDAAAATEGAPRSPRRRSRPARRSTASSPTPTA